MVVQLFGDFGPWVDPDVLRAEHEAARDAWKAATAGGVAYTQDALDAVRVLRNAAELAAWRWAWCLSVVRGRGYPTDPQPTPVAVPGVYPGIAGPLVAPTDIAGCALWLSSDLGVTVDLSGNVTAWADQSGLGNDAIWDLGKYQYLTNVFGTTVGLFNDTTQGTFKSASATRVLPPGNARTVFVVAKAHFIDDGAIFLDMQPGRTTAAKSFSCGIFNRGNAGTLNFASDLASIDEHASSPPTVADTSQIYAYRWAGNGHNVEFAVGGATPAALVGTALTTETGDDGYTIGHGYGSAHHGPMRGSIGSVIVYDSVLSTDQYNRVCVFLKNRFNLAAP